MTRDAFDQFAPRDRGRFGDNETQSAKGPRVTGASDLVDLGLFLHNDNPAKKAIAVSYAADTPFEKWVWLPRSLIECEPLGNNIHGRRGVRVTMPEHVAHEKGLVLIRLTHADTCASTMGINGQFSPAPMEG